MLQDILDTAKEKMKKSCEVYERDMMGLRAGRANPKLLDRIMVDYYGTPTPIPQIGNISSPEPRLLVIAPFALVMHVPASMILDKPLYGWPMWVAFVTPLSGLVLFGIMYLLFRKAMRFYRSTGS